jgi:hypothetical protein
MREDRFELSFTEVDNFVTSNNESPVGMLGPSASRVTGPER